MLERDEYIEQAYFFRMLVERQHLALSTQELMASSREEILSTTKLPLAIDFLVSQIRFHGLMAPGMAHLKHYFTPFQTFIVQCAEDERGRLDFTIAMQILEKEAEYRAENPSPQGLFIYQFEAVARNRLGYEKSLIAIAADPIYDEHWREWITFVRRQIGLYQFADLLYLRSEYYLQQRQKEGTESEEAVKPLFGEKEGKIAWANRTREPVFLFAALERHLNYPTVPRPTPRDESQARIPELVRAVQNLESRVKLLEDEARGGIDLTKFYAPPEEDPKPENDDLI